MQITASTLLKHRSDAVMQQAAAEQRRPEGMTQVYDAAGPKARHLDPPVPSPGLGQNASIARSDASTLNRSLATAEASNSRKHGTTSRQNSIRSSSKLSRSENGRLRSAKALTPSRRRPNHCTVTAKTFRSFGGMPATTAAPIQHERDGTAKQHQQRNSGARFRKNGEHAAFQTALRTSTRPPRQARITPRAPMTQVCTTPKDPALRAGKLELERFAGIFWDEEALGMCWDGVALHTSLATLCWDAKLASGAA